MGFVHQRRGLHLGDTRGTKLPVGDAVQRLVNDGNDLIERLGFSRSLLAQQPSNVVTGGAGL